ncbi:MAG: phenylalanine--tRNA ligase subunit beta [Peptococcaceae bacterium]|nr:phenylalanine--tRNA ligase subunit beta [Peptococcaceae bacterium]
MKVSYNWLKNYVAVEEAPEKIAAVLTDAGVAVDAIVSLNEGLEGAVTGKLLSVEPHPNASKLLVCQVDINTQVITIVTGASNVAAGQVVPVGLVGTKLPDGTVLGVADFRGINSYGMLLSADELGIEKKVVPTYQREGIYILPPDTEVGQNVISVFGFDDYCFELDLTPNRADCLSMVGVAWDVAALTGARVKASTGKALGEVVPASTELRVEIQDQKLCPGYLGLVVESVIVQESPLWLQNMLRSVGLRPINNIVDITNFIMWELGQPLHAFDYEKLAGQRIIVRPSVAGETIVTLDGEERKLPEGTLIIADELRPVAIAGVMGSLGSEVTIATKRIVIESALFNLVSIRRTSRLVGLRSDASARFDKGLDPAGVTLALSRAAELIEQLGCGKITASPVGITPDYEPITHLSLRPDRVNSLLGTNLKSVEMQTILARLGFAVVDHGATLAVAVPSRRRDVVHEVDLVEEIGRIHGLEHIPTLSMSGELTQGKLTSRQKMLRTLRRLLVGTGLNEILTLSFYDPAFKEALSLDDSHPWSKPIVLQNPLSRERSALRPSLVPGMIDVLKHNQARQVPGMIAFEIGTAFDALELPIARQPRERLTLSLGAYGVKRGNWLVKNHELDFFHVKGIIETLLPAAAFSTSSYVYLHPGRQADILIDNEVVGVIGEVHPRVDLRERTVVAELDLEKSLSAFSPEPHYTGMRRFLSVERDMAFVVSATVPVRDVIACVQKAAGNLLQNVTLFDVYVGKNLPQGMVSLALRMEFSKDSGTLNETELSEVIVAIRQAVEASFAAQLRS